MAEVVEKPIVVDPNSAKTQASTFGRDLLLIIGAIPALIAVLGTRDVEKIVDFLGSSEFAPVAGVLMTVATVLYRQWLARHKNAQLVTVAANAPDSVAIVKQTVPTIAAQPMPEPVSIGLRPAELRVDTARSSTGTGDEVEILS